MRASSPDRRRRRIVGTAAVFVVILLSGVTAALVSPWPGVLVVRWMSAGGSEATHAQLDRHAPSGIVSVLDQSYREGDDDAQLDVCGGDEAARIQRDILAQARRQGLYFGSLRDAARIGSKVCYAARPYNFLIGATGKVMKCTIVLDKDDHNIVGRITPEGDLELDGDRMALWTEPAFEQDSKCRKCVVLPTCQGISCPLIRIEDDKQPCISTRSNPKGELLQILDMPGIKERHVSVGNRNAKEEGEPVIAPN